MIEPTVGRVVWYRHPHEASPYPKLGDQPFAAHIAFVHSERLLNLLVIAHNGHAYAAENVLLLQDGDTPPVAAPYAEWMPYQKGQAAKAEALQGQLSASQAPPPLPEPTTAPPPTTTAAPPPPEPTTTAPPPPEPQQAVQQPPGLTPAPEAAQAAPAAPAAS